MLCFEKKGDLILMLLGKWTYWHVDFLSHPVYITVCIVLKSDVIESPDLDKQLRIKSYCVMTQLSVCHCKCLFMEFTNTNKRREITVKRFIFDKYHCAYLM